MLRSLWPDNKNFAFTVFDDTDSQTLERCRAVYSLISDLGFRTTKSVWTIRGVEKTDDPGATCEEPEYVEWLQELQCRGFEIGYHMAAPTTSRRPDTIQALERFAQLFGHYPKVMAGHYASRENVYFGTDRVTGFNKLLYNLLTGFRNRGVFRGHIPGDPLFWGDLCKQHIQYVRNFVFADINTLKVCPEMPYHDPRRPYVNYWFASSEGSTVHTFNERISEERQDQLEQEGGACIMYTHFGLGFYEDGSIHARFRELMRRLSRKNGWFVPVSVLLNHLLVAKGQHILTDAERARLERRWLLHKIRFGSA